MTLNGYEKASKRYSPSFVSLLFIAESPPDDQERYFYYPEVEKHDHLWIALMKALYPGEFAESRQERRRKHEWLRRFQKDGFKLVDAFKKPFPRGESSKKRCLLLRKQAGALISEVREINPGRVLLIKTTVYDALYEPLRTAGLPILDARLPFPGNGRQGEFHNEFRNLVQEGKITLPITR